MASLELVSLITYFAAILIIAVAIAVGVTRVHARQMITQLERENAKLNHKLDLLICKQISVTDSATFINPVSERSRALREQIEHELHKLAAIMEVDSISVLVPYPACHDSKFCFLSVLGEEAHNLRYTLIDLDKGFAGDVFKQGKPIISNHVNSDSRWYRNFDRRIPFRTKNLLCLPLTNKGKAIGVVQILNKQSGFSNSDLTLAVEHIVTLNRQVGEFVQDPTHFNVLGIAHSQLIDEGTILVADLSNLSSLLTQNRYFPETHLINLINEYFESLTLIGLSYGGVVDHFSWGGFIMNFNISKQVENHRIVAVEAAFEMNLQFEELKKAWQRDGFPVTQIFNRIAVASGLILEVSLGPPEHRQRTVVGDPVTIASTLSALAPQDHNVVTADRTVYTDLSSLNIKSDKVPPEEINKVPGLIQDAYRIRLQSAVA